MEASKFQISEPIWKVDHITSLSNILQQVGVLSGWILYKSCAMGWPCLESTVLQLYSEASGSYNPSVSSVMIPESRGGAAWVCPSGCLTESGMQGLACVSGQQAPPVSTSLVLHYSITPPDFHRTVEIWTRFFIHPWEACCNLSHHSAPGPWF